MDKTKNKKEKKEKKKKEKKEKKKKEKKEKKKKEKKKKKDKTGNVRSSSSSTSTSSLATVPSSSIFNITKDDYFRKGPNFRYWLKQFKQIDFEDLQTVKARQFFEEFVQLWNTNQLPTAITSPSSDVLRSQPRTKFAWGIQTSKKEQHDIDSLHDNIAIETNKRKSGTLGPSGPPRKKATSSSNFSSSTNSRRDLILARAKAAEAAEDEKMKQFKIAMGLK
jgi:hypothetical protein